MSFSQPKSIYVSFHTPKVGALASKPAALQDSMKQIRDAAHVGKLREWIAIAIAILQLS